MPVVVVVDWWWPPLHTACAEMQKKWMEFYLCGGGQNSTNIHGSTAVVLYAPHKKIQSNKKNGPGAMPQVHSFRLGHVRRRPLGAQVGFGAMTQ